MQDGFDVNALVERATGWLLDPLRALDLALLLVLVIALVWLTGIAMVIREITTRHALVPYRRVRLRLRSTTAAQRSIEEVDRWAAQLSRVRRRVRRFADRPAQAVRIRLESTPAGPAYTMEGSRLAEPILTNPTLSQVRLTRLPPGGAPVPARGGDGSEGSSPGAHP